MAKQSERAIAAVVLFLTVLAAVGWVPSATAQPLPERSTLVNLRSSTISSGFINNRLAFSSRSNIPFCNPTEVALSPRKPEKEAPALSTLVGTKVNEKLPAEFDCTGSMNANEARTKLVGTNPPAWGQKLVVPMASARIQVAPTPVPGLPRIERLPALSQEDCAFSTQVRMPLADVWEGRLQLDSFYRELSNTNFVRGLPESSDTWWTSRRGLALRPSRSYGISLSFRLGGKAEPSRRTFVRQLKMWLASF